MAAFLSVHLLAFVLGFCLAAGSERCLSNRVGGEFILGSNICINSTPVQTRGTWCQVFLKRDAGPGD